MLNDAKLYAEEDEEPGPWEHPEDEPPNPEPK